MHGLSCSRSAGRVKRGPALIAGPTVVHLCDECIGLCNDIIAEEIEKDDQPFGPAAFPKPSEIKNVLDEFVIGQDRAKRFLGRGSQPLQAHRRQSWSREVELQKSNICCWADGLRQDPARADAGADAQRRLPLPMRRT